MPATIVSIFEVPDYQKQVAAAARLLDEGKLVVLPTETVYGTAGALSEQSALERLKALRGNAAGHPFTIHLANAAQAGQYLGEVSDLARRMMTKLWPGPVAIQFDVSAERRKQVAKKTGLAEEDLYSGGVITLRCPDHRVATDVLAGANKPVALIRAGDEAQAIHKELGDKVDLILDAGPARHSKPSTMIHVSGEKYTIVREGIYDQRIIERLLRTTVLFVCSGNTCRSPMAEGIARKVLADKLHVRMDELESRGISVVSAGSFALPGARATPQAVDALKEIGIDLTRHRSRPLSVELIHSADAIYTMSRNHAQAVAALVPSASEKTRTLDPDKDVEDPIGGDLSLYQELTVDLQRLIENRLAESVPL